MTDYVENKIFSDKYDLFDRTLYGGVGHGVIIIPTNIFKVLFTVIFPPLGELINDLQDVILDEFPYVTSILYSFICGIKRYKPKIINKSCTYS